MGRIKTLQIKRVTFEFMERFGEIVTDDFRKNKELVNQKITGPSKKIKNIIAGYITRLVRQNNGE